MQNAILESQPIHNTLRYEQCPLCQSIALKRLGEIECYIPLFYSSTQISLTHKPELWECQNCRSRFTQNAVSEQDSAKLYTQSSAAQRWANPDFATSKPKVVVETLTALFQPGHRVLDVGCNAGNLLDFASQLGCQTSGLEYSTASLDILRGKGHQAFSSWEEVENTFDVITGFDLIEHLYNVPDFLETCLQRLAPQGHLVLLTGDVGCLPAQFTHERWWYVAPPEHIVFPSKRYFEEYSPLKLIQWIPTFVKRPKVLPSLRRLLFQEVLRLRPDGLTWLVPDHALIVLQKC